MRKFAVERKILLHALRELCVTWQMAKFIYPTEEDFRIFITSLREDDWAIKKYLPPTTKQWFRLVPECIKYVEDTSHYENLSFSKICARILYKVAKRHELEDGNKRSAVIAVYLFCLLNDCHIDNPKVVKQQARRVAKTKGRINETIMRDRIAIVLRTVIGGNNYN